MIRGQDRDSLYFQYRPAAGHFDNCPLHGTNTWEVTRYQDRDLNDEVRSTELRYACHQCGAVTFEQFNGEPDRLETSDASRVGYAGKPERVAGLWLWPGPLIWAGDNRGPATYLVTVTDRRPVKPEDCAGLIGWGLGKRGGIVWQAGAGPTGHGTVATPAGQDFRSKHAAVRWIKDQATPQGAAA